METKKSSGGRSPWRIVAGAVAGLSAGNGPVMQFTFGIFLLPVAETLGVQRGTISLALLVGLLCTGIATPLVGMLVDRFGVRAVALRAIVLFAIGMAAIGMFARSGPAFVCLYGLAGIAAAGQSPLTYCKVIAAAFDRQRGLALGVALAGVGIGAALMPLLARLMIAAWGWRAAYAGLAGLTLLLAWPSMAYLVTRKGDGAAVPLAGAAARGDSKESVTAGVSGREAVRSIVFWQLAFVFFVVAMAASGVTAHIVPLMTDRGVGAGAAAGALSIAGLALVAGRLLAGYLLDRIFAPLVAALFFALPLAGIGLLLGTGGADWAIPAAILVGLGLGAEVDLIAFLVSRYLGLRAFGQLYGYLFAVFMLGSGLGPFLMGMSFQGLHSYDPALGVLAGLLALACVAMLRFGPYRYGSAPDGAVAPAAGAQAVPHLNR